MSKNNGQVNGLLTFAGGLEAATSMIRYERLKNLARDVRDAEDDCDDARDALQAHLDLGVGAFDPYLAAKLQAAVNDAERSVHTAQRDLDRAQSEGAVTSAISGAATLGAGLGYGAMGTGGGGGEDESEGGGFSLGDAAVPFALGVGTGVVLDEALGDDRDRRRARRSRRNRLLA